MSDSTVQRSAFCDSREGEGLVSRPHERAQLGGSFEELEAEPRKEAEALQQEARQVQIHSQKRCTPDVFATDVLQVL